jgi:hypothetical protein
MEMPRAFEPPSPPPYTPEEDDRLLPSRGFITDFVETWRGAEVPTLFCMWTALWTLSAASSRLISMDWLPDEPLYPNLYVFLVAPPGRCHKSTGLNFGKKVLMGMPDEFDNGTAMDGFLKYMFDINWMTSKTTPDVVYELLKPKETLIIGNDKQINVKKGSQLVGCISELATFLNKKKFMSGIVETLTDLYDCRGQDVIHTISRGTLELKDIYVTLIGATTPTGMKESLPYEVFGEGFASRVMIVYKERTSRSYSEPCVFDGFPTLPDLRHRLAWIMRHKLGTYCLADDAREWYRDWYANWKYNLDHDERYNERVAEFRFDVNMLRLGLLISMSRYDTALIVEKRDLLEATTILRGTFSGTVKANVEAGIALNEFNGNYGRIVEFVRKLGSTDRQQLTRNMSSKGISMSIVREVLSQLHTEGRVVVREGTLVKDKIGWTKSERYEWVADITDTKGA